MKRKYFMVALLLLSVVLAGCRTETQNRIRRNIQDLTNQRMFITLLSSQDGTIIYTSTVQGKVTRAGNFGDGANFGQEVTGGYIYWFDDQGRYHQSNLNYVVSTREVPPATTFR